jgi:hypothetical protein
MAKGGRITGSEIRKMMSNDAVRQVYEVYALEQRQE